MTFGVQRLKKARAALDYVYCLHGIIRLILQLNNVA